MVVVVVVRGGDVFALGGVLPDMTEDGGVGDTLGVFLEIGISLGAEPDTVADAVCSSIE